MDDIILVDEKDNSIGTGEKMDVHKRGLMHRAFSIFIFNSRGEMMIQKRASAKYHSGGLWSNACCSHPRPGEGLQAAAQRRLEEEMGFSCPLSEIFSFTYKADLGGLWENEYDHVFAGRYESDPKLNPDEAEGWRWIGFEDLKKDIEKNPKNYTVWFKIIFAKACEFWKKDR